MRLTHSLAALPHEFSHSIVAWIVGIKPVPGDIDRGGTSLWNPGEPSTLAGVGVGTAPLPRLPRSEATKEATT